LLVVAARALLDGPVIPECPEGVLYFADAGWHNDDGIGVVGAVGVKFATYFDPLGAANGALQFVPGSHDPEQTARLVDYRKRHLQPSPDTASARDGASLPGAAADTASGDVIAFDLHTWHASFGGRDRLAWTVVYLRCPRTDAEHERTLMSMNDSFEQAFRGFDRDRYPIWRDWLSAASLHSRRGPVIAG
jgi:hypothetical protein